MSRVKSTLAGLPGIISVDFTEGDNYILVHESALSDEDIVEKVLALVVAPGARKLLGQIGEEIDPGQP